MCMQHTILVTTVICTLLSVIAALFAGKWWHWLSLVSSIVTTFIGIPAGLTLRPKLLIGFTVMDGLDLIFKLICMGYLIHYRMRINDNCSPFDAKFHEDCPKGNWRLKLLNVNNGIVFYTIGALIELFLFIYGICLINNVRRYPPMSQKEYSRSLSEMEKRGSNAVAANK